MRVVICRSGTWWLEDWPCKTERAVRAAMQLKYGEGQEPEEVPVPSQYSVGWKVGQTEVWITALQPEAPPVYVTPVAAVTEGPRVGNVESLRTLALRRMDRLFLAMEEKQTHEASEEYHSAVRSFFQRFGKSLGVQK